MTIYWTIKKNSLYISHNVGVLFTSHLHEAFLYTRKHAAEAAAKELNGKVVAVNLEIVENVDTVKVDTGMVQPSDQGEEGDNN